jgi:lambda repressor-like predicted transcriptional regulator
VVDKVTDRIDWSAVVVQLRERGMSYRQLHRVSGLSVGMLYNLANSLTQEPSHSEGERLLAILRAVAKPENVQTLNG